MQKNLNGRVTELERRSGLGGRRLSADDFREWSAGLLDDHPERIAARRAVAGYECEHFGFGCDEDGGND